MHVYGNWKNFGTSLCKKGGKKLETYSTIAVKNWEKAPKKITGGFFWADGQLWPTFSKFCLTPFEKKTKDDESFPLKTTCVIFDRT